MSTSIRSITMPLAGFLLIGAQAALATCVPGGSYVRYVGDTTSDTQCTDNDIQSAINNTQCPNTTIFITDEHTYTAQHLDIDGKSVALIGKAAGVGCGLFFEPPPPTTPLISISGVGHSGDSVLYIHGNSNVTLQYLTIEGGTNLTGYGGGIHFDGTGSLVLDTTWVRNNKAGYGGGINFTGSGGFAGLTVLGYTQFINNTAANSGGGIRIDGQSYMSVLYDNTLIALNHAPGGYGGGVDVVGPAHADIGSPGFGNLAVVYANDARYGGGLAVTGSDGGSAEALLFTTDPLRPVRVYDNFASTSGGGIYAKSQLGFVNYNFGGVCAFDFRIDQNSAPEGSAIFLDGESGLTADIDGLLEFNSSCNGELPSSAQRCAAGVPCNTVNNNVAVDANNSPTLGATIRLGRADFRGDRFTMQDNRGGYAIRSSGQLVEASDCLLTDNNVTRQLLNSTSGILDFNNCTFANNAILSTDTIHAEGPLTLADSIIDQPGNLALAYSGNAADLHVEYVLSSDLSTLPAVEGVLAGRPTFVDAAHRDYRLQVTSLGIDYAPAIAGDDRDLDNRPHDQDLPQVSNSWGVRDLGAYERQHACSVADTIFCDSFDP